MQARKIYHLGTEKLSLRYRKVTNVGIAKLSFKYRKVKNIGTENLGMISDVTFFFYIFVLNGHLLHFIMFGSSLCLEIKKNLF